MPNRRIDTEQIVGCAEIADRAGTSRQAVSNWRTRDVGFPNPIAELECGPIFYWPEVMDWLDKTGRYV